MKRIYKRIEVASSEILLTLALFSDVGGAESVDAADLDRLEAQLSRPNYTGAEQLPVANVQRSHLEITNEGEVLAVLHRLKRGENIFVCKARYGTNISVQLTIDFVVTDPNETIPVEISEDVVLVESIGDGGGGGGDFPTDYAKQGTDPTATNSAILAAVQSISDIESDVQAGRKALATNITAKGVPTSTSDALITMATKVLQIPQQLNTGISEFEQMIAPSPYMWNVYTVATDLMKETLPQYIPSYMSSGIYVQYRANNAFFVGEYYLGYDTLELTGADGYLTCDGHFYVIAGDVGSRIVTHTLPDGTVETYSAESIVHTWTDGASGYCNRWVAFFYLSDAYSFMNTSENICPRRVALCGNCLSFIVSTANRLTDVWVIGTLGHFEGGTTGNTWNPSQVIRNYSVHNVGFCYYDFSGQSAILPDLNEISGAMGTCSLFRANAAKLICLPNLQTLSSSLFFRGDVSGESAGANIERIIIRGLTTISGNLTRCMISTNNASCLPRLSEVILEDVETISNTLFFFSVYNPANNQGGLSALKRLYMPKLKRVTANFISSANKANSPSYPAYEIFRNLTDVFVGALETGLNLRQWEAYGVADKSVIAANLKDHFLANVSDRTGLSALTLTVGTALYNAISTMNVEWQGQTMTLADAFLTKNWLLAGA